MFDELSFVHILFRNLYYYFPFEPVMTNTTGKLNKIVVNFLKEPLAHENIGSKFDKIDNFQTSIYSSDNL